MARGKGTHAAKRGEDMTLRDLLIQKLQVLYFAEQQIMEALPAMAEHATDETLADAFDEHLEQTREQAKRLEQAFAFLGEKAEPMESDGIAGIIADGEWVMEHVGGPEALDANLIAAAQYVEHYEIAGYGSAHAWAIELGEEEVADLLEQSLAEERETDEKLDELATTVINARAAGGTQAADDESEAAEDLEAEDTKDDEEP